MNPETKEYFLRNLSVLTVLSLVVYMIALNASSEEKTNNLAELTRVAEIASIEQVNADTPVDPVEDQIPGSNENVTQPNSEVLESSNVWPVTLPDETLVYCASGRTSSTSDVVQLLQEKGIIADMPQEMLIVGAIGGVWRDFESVSLGLDLACFEVEG